MNEKALAAPDDKIVPTHLCKEQKIKNLTFVTNRSKHDSGFVKKPSMSRWYHCPLVRRCKGRVREIEILTRRARVVGGIGQITFENGTVSRFVSRADLRNENSQQASQACICNANEDQDDGDNLRLVIIRHTTVFCRRMRLKSVPTGPVA